MQNNKFLNEIQAAELLGCAVQTMRNWRHRRVGPTYIKMGKKSVRYDRDDLIRYMSRQKIILDEGMSDTAFRGLHEK